MPLQRQRRSERRRRRAAVSHRRSASSLSLASRNGTPSGLAPQFPCPEPCVAILLFGVADSLLIPFVDTNFPTSPECAGARWVICARAAQVPAERPPGIGKSRDSSTKGGSATKCLKSRRTFWSPTRTFSRGPLVRETLNEGDASGSVTTQPEKQR